jgi:type IV secretion system protein VirB6
MRQVMPMAAGLASGLALSSFGVVSAALAWGLGGAVRGTGQFGRGLLDRETSRFDPLARRAAFALHRGVMRAVSRPWRENQVRRVA